MPFKIPTSVKIREKKFSEGVWREKGVKKRGLQVGNMYVLVIQTRPVGFVPAPFSA